MLGEPSLFVGIPLEHREVNNPEGLPGGRVDEFKMPRCMQANLPERLAGREPFIAAHQDGVARLNPEGGREFLCDAVDELGDATFKAVFGDLGPRQTTCAVQFGGVLQLVEHFAGERLGRVRNPNRLDDAAILGQCRLEDLEVGLGGDFGDVLQVQFESHIGPIDTPLIDCQLPRNFGNLTEIEVEQLLEDAADEASHDLDDLVTIHEREFQIDLREFRLSIRAGVLVPQALADLDVAVATSDHQNLLEDLWALRQGVPLAGIDAGGNDEVACSFWGALDQQWCFDFEEAEVVEVLPGECHEVVTHLKRSLHGRPAEVDVAVSKTNLLGHFGRFVVVGEDRGVVGS